MLESRLLTAKPPPGSVPESSFTPSARANTWVRFSDSAGAFEDWVGVFGNAEVAFFSAAVPFADGRHALIVAGGQGYVVDAHSRALVRRTPWSYSYSAWAVPGRAFVMVASNCALWATTIQGERAARLSEPWFTSREKHGQSLSATERDHERVALDGLVFEAVDTTQLRGHAWWPDGWHPFVLDFDTWRLEQSAPVAQTFEAHQAQQGRGGYPTSREYYDWMASHWLR